MKKLSLFLLLISGSCQTGEPAHPIVGDWRWVSSSGGFGGWTVKPKNNDERVLRFTADGRFEISTNNVLFYSGKYRLSGSNSIYNNRQEPSLMIDGFMRNKKDTLNYYPFLLMNGSLVRKFSSNELELADNCYDCYGHSFVRK